MYSNRLAHQIMEKFIHIARDRVNALIQACENHLCGLVFDSNNQQEMFNHMDFT